MIKTETINKIVDYKKAMRRFGIVGTSFIAWKSISCYSAVAVEKVFAKKNLRAAVDSEMISCSQANGMRAAYEELFEISFATAVSI